MELLKHKIMPVEIIIVQKGLNYLIFSVFFRFIYLLDGLIFDFLVIDLYTKCLSNCPVTSKWILMKSKHLQKVQFQQLINHTTDKISSCMVHLWTKIGIFQTKILSFIICTDSLLKVLSTNKNQRGHRGGQSWSNSGSLASFSQPRSTVIILVFSFPINTSAWFWYQCNTDLIRWLGKCFLFNFLKGFA